MVEPSPGVRRLWVRFHLLKVCMKHNNFNLKDMHMIEHMNTSKMFLFEANQSMHSRDRACQILNFYSSSGIFTKTSLPVRPSALSK